MLPVVGLRKSRGGGQGTIRRSTFTENFASRTGGAFSLAARAKLDIDADTSIECNMASSGGALAASPDASALTLPPSMALQRNAAIRGAVGFVLGANTTEIFSALGLSASGAAPAECGNNNNASQVYHPLYCPRWVSGAHAPGANEPWMNLTRGCDWAEESARRGGRCFATMPARLTWSDATDARCAVARAAASPPPTARPLMCPWSTCMGRRCGRTIKPSSYA